VGGFRLTILWILLAIVAAGLFYQWVGVMRDARRFPPPGRMIDIGSTPVHANIRGEGVPVIFEAGIAATSLSWSLVQPEVARFAQTIAYDRAGFGWSGPARGRRDAWHSMEELRAMLDRAGVVSPRVMVAHSYGSLIALAYASRYPEEIKGIVLVDPVAATEWADTSPGRLTMLARAIFLSRFGGLLAQLGVVRFALHLAAGGARTAPKLIARASSGRGGSDFIERMVGQVRKLPREVWPMVQSHWCDPKCFATMAGYLRALPESAASVLEASKNISVPVLTLEAETIEGTGHWIQLDRPDIVIDAVSRMIH
jgi:pimeloyl-ACP methyl ester carboxylesterase